jgi:hypothetical protein
MGKDERGNEVYVMGCRNAGSLVERALREFSRIMNINHEEVIFVGTMPCLNILLKLGGFLSRSFNLVTLGRLLLYPGCMLAYRKIAKVVEEVKSRSCYC